MVIKETIAVLSVIILLISIPLCILLYQYVFVPSTYLQEERVFNITAVGEPSGAYTLEEINGLNYWWKRFAPMTLLLEVGDQVILNLKSADSTHQFYVPELGLDPVTVTPGKVETLSFTAEKKGIYQYFCTTMCGDCHTFMTGWIVISEKDDPVKAPHPIVCPLCAPDFGIPPQTEMLDLGEYLYQKLGCVGCHGWFGKGGIRNPNYAKQYVPAHNTTTDKLFLKTPEDAAKFCKWLITHESIPQSEDSPDIPMFNFVSARYQALKDIAKNGSTPEKLDKTGPEPPLWMPAWKFRLADREFDAIILYFITLKKWEEDEEIEGADLFTQRVMLPSGSNPISERSDIYAVTPA